MTLLSTLLLAGLSGGVMFALAGAVGVVLGWANEAFHVEEDPRLAPIKAALPGANCGGCGFLGCADFAEAVLSGAVAPDQCPAGGRSTAEAIAQVLGIDYQAGWPLRPVVHCGANREQRVGSGAYRGEASCASANLVAGVQDCVYGCLGFGDCAQVCAWDAIDVGDGLARIDYDACTGCGACADTCPRNLISLVPFKADRMMVVACSNRDKGPDVRKVCRVGCIGCSACSRASDLFSLQDDLAQIDYDRYDPDCLGEAGAAMEACPMKGIVTLGQSAPAVAEPLELELAAPDFRTTADDAPWRG
jgi:RnfABCDGE-type electron transport complex B subunit